MPYANARRALDRPRRTAPFTALLAALALALLGACGGGGSGDGSTASSTPAPAPSGSSGGDSADGADGDASGDAADAAPFGLIERAPTAAFTLPEAGSADGAYDLEDAFPTLPDFAASVFVAAVPGTDRLVVVEQSGRLLAIDDDPAASSATEILDLTDRVLFGGEQGLLGLAFDPDFVANRALYVHYIADGPRRSIIARFRWDAASDRVDPASEAQLLVVEQPFSNHNGGMLAFGPDDHLYVAFGDGGSGGDPLNSGQDPATLLGTILRLDVDATAPGYAIPADNPFVGDDAFRDEIWALGLRNPFRFSFDAETGALWVGDVGQGAFEEIDRVDAGDNLGWRRFEGASTFDAATPLALGTTHTPPVIDYGRDEGVAVIGGYVYRGTRLPSLVGRYLYSDFGSGTVWALDAAADDRVRANDVIATAPNPASFGETGDGEVLIVTLGGRLLRFVDAVEAGTVPAMLSQTGLFTDLATLRPASGLIEYALNVPFWSDGAVKRRWFAVPDDAVIDYAPDAAWGLPVGSVVVKHFELATDAAAPEARRRLETRVLVHRTTGWAGYSWRWNEAQDDAELLSGRETALLEVSDADGATTTQRYDFPSRTDCLRCHTAAAGDTLGLETRQLNRDFDYAPATDNQLRALDHVGLFDGPVDAGDAERYADLADEAAPLGTRARAYLAVNCASCHRPGGGTPVTLDLRRSAPTSGLDAAPEAGDLGIDGARIVVPGDRTRSLLWRRMDALDGDRMPPLSSHVRDTAGLELVGRWIDTL